MKIEDSTITNANATVLLQAGLAAIESGDAEFDFGAVAQCDSSAVAVLLAWKRAAKARGLALRIASLPRSLQSLAALYGVDGLIA